MNTSVKLYDINGKSTKEIKLPENLFVEQPHKQAIFDCVIAENAALRQGTHSTLTKGEVRGGGKKPWRQKHTGRARTGSIRNPQWTGGGVVFGPKPNRNYLKKVNAKVRILAFKSVLSLKLLSNNLFAMESTSVLKKPSTKLMSDFINNAGLNNKKVLIISNSNENNIQKSTNNLVDIETKLWNSVSVKDVLNANVLIVFEDVFSMYNDQFSKKLSLK